MDSTFFNYGLGPDQSADCEFSDRILPHLGSYGDYDSYKEGVKLCTYLTTRPDKKYGPALAGLLQNEAKNAAKTLESTSFAAKETSIINREPNPYTIDETDQPDAGMADFLVYS